MWCDMITNQADICSSSYDSYALVGHDDIWDEFSL